MGLVWGCWAEVDEIWACGLIGLVGLVRFWQEDKLIGPVVGIWTLNIKLDYWAFDKKQIKQNE